MWIRNPYEESRLCPYRTPKPVISKVDAVNTNRIPPFKREAVHLNSEHGFQPGDV